jgi:hypothetical protein
MAGVEEVGVHLELSFALLRWASVEKARVCQDNKGKKDKSKSLRDDNQETGNGKSEKVNRHQCK